MQRTFLGVAWAFILAFGAGGASEFGGVSATGGASGIDAGRSIGGSRGQTADSDRAVGSVPSADTIRSAGGKNLPLINVPATGAASDSNSDLLVVHYTGDGGWGVTDKGLGTTFASMGIPFVAVNSLHYFWKQKTPEEATADLERILRDRLAAWQKRRVILVGYSFGADVVPFLFNRLPADLKARIPLVALLGPDADAEFGIHLTAWLGPHRRADSLPVVPEVGRMAGVKVLCISGRKDPDAICKDLDAAQVTRVDLEGGHRIGKRFEKLAARILQELR